MDEKKKKKSGCEFRKTRKRQQKEAKALSVKMMSYLQTSSSARPTMLSSQTLADPHVEPAAEGKELNTGVSDSPKLTNDALQPVISDEGDEMEVASLHTSIAPAEDHVSKNVETDSTRCTW